MAPVHTQLQAFWAELGVPHLDLLRTFEAHPAKDMAVNEYDPHPNARAHEVAFQAIAEFLDRLPAFP
jgi:hypothetical protein